jgi:hypothetical protein
MGQAGTAAAAAEYHCKRAAKSSSSFLRSSPALSSSQTAPHAASGRRALAPTAERPNFKLPPSPFQLANHACCDRVALGRRGFWLLFSLNRFRAPDSWSIQARARHPFSRGWVVGCWLHRANKRLAAARAAWPPPFASKKTRARGGYRRLPIGSSCGRRRTVLRASLAC